jgi:hypothetical protein
MISRRKIFDENIAPKNTNPPLKGGKRACEQGDLILYSTLTISVT